MLNLLAIPAVEDSAEMSLYEPLLKEWTLRLRSNDRKKSELEAVVRLWRLLARYRKDNAGITLSDVIRRIIDHGITQAFSEFGGMPTNEAGWSRIESVIAAANDVGQEQRQLQAIMRLWSTLGRFHGAEWVLAKMKSTSGTDLLKKYGGVPEDESAWQQLEDEIAAEAEGASKSSR